jgi:hypothetical protein
MDRGVAFSDAAIIAVVDAVVGKLHKAAEPDRAAAIIKEHVMGRTADLFGVIGIIDRQQGDNILLIEAVFRKYIR